MPDCPLNTDSAAEQEASYTPACKQIQRTAAVYCGLFNNTYIVCVYVLGCVFPRICYIFNYLFKDIFFTMGLF